MGNRVFACGATYGNKPKIVDKNIKDIAVGRNHHLSLTNDNKAISVGLDYCDEEVNEYFKNKIIKMFIVVDIIVLQ